MSKSTSAPAELPARLRQKTAVICTVDIARATSIIHEIDDSIGVALYLDGFYHLCSQHITSGGGEVVKYMGDECLALFATERWEEIIDAMMGLRAAFPEYCIEQGVKPTDLKIAANLGDIIDGNFGPEGYRDFLGKSVGNLFLMDGPGITISQQLYRKLPSEKRGPWKKKGGEVVYHLP